MSNIVSISQAVRIMQRTVTELGPQAKILLQGPPGVAKSSIIKQLYKFLDYDVYTEKRISQESPEGMCGYPYIDEGIMRLARPEWFPNRPRTVLNLEEIGQGGIPMQNVALQLMLDRAAGPHTLPDDTLVIGCTNRPEDRAGANALTTALISRFNVILTIEPEKQEWLDWAKLNNLNPFLIAWAEKMLETVSDFDPRAKGGFLCPRTLEEASKLVTVYNADHENPDLRPCLHGLLGDQYALGLLGFLQAYNTLPDYADIIADPEGALMGDAIVQPVSSMIKAQAKFAHIPKLIRYIVRYTPENQAVFVVALNKTIDHPDLQELAEKLGMV